MICHEYQTDSAMQFQRKLSQTIALQWMRPTREQFGNNRCGLKVA